MTTGTSPRKPTQPDRAMLMDSLSWEQVTSPNLNFLKAVGVECIRVATPPAVVDGCRPHRRVQPRAHVRRGARHPARCAARRGLPKDKIIYGREGREEQVQHWITMVRAIGAAGVPIDRPHLPAHRPLPHHAHPWPRRGACSPRSTWKSSTPNRAQFARPGREGSGPDPFTGRELSEDQLWESAAWFFTRVVRSPKRPACASPSTRRPARPRPAGGAARIITSMENYDRIYNLAPSPSNAMLFCQGCFAEMGGDLYEQTSPRRLRGADLLRPLPRHRGHPLQLPGSVHRRRAERHAEGHGDVPRQRLPRPLHDGPHAPARRAGSTAWHGHAYANGYIKALILTVYGT